MLHGPLENSFLEINGKVRNKLWAGIISNRNERSDLIWITYFPVITDLNIVYKYD